MTGESIDHQEGGSPNRGRGFFYRHRKGLGYAALALFGAPLVVAIPAVRIWGQQVENNEVAAVQKALPATGFQGTVQELSGVAVDQAYADLQVSPTCTLPGVVVSYTFAEDGAHVVSFDLQEVYTDGSSTDQSFTGPADLPLALARDQQTCAQAEAQLRAQAPYTGAW